MSKQQLDIKNKTTLAWQIKLFIICVLLPPELGFSLGSFRLSVYRIVLIVFFIPCLLKLFSGKTMLADKLMVFYGIWLVIVLSIHHGIDTGIESGGALMIESLGAYILARCYLTSSDSYRKFVNFMFVMLVLLSCITLVESLTGNNIIRPNVIHLDKRIGLTRAFGPFDHPILFGVFCSSLFSLLLYINKDVNKVGQLMKGRAMLCTFTTFLSVSSGALSAIIVQFLFTVWDHVTRKIAGRWKLLSFLFVLIYIFIDILSNRTPMRVILHRLTFSAHTAYNRLIIWEWGTKYNVAEHPLLGIGFAEWIRPSWMHSTSMDNFWLVNMVRYGLPSFFILAIVILYLLINVSKKRSPNNELQYMKKGYAFSLLGLIIAGCTVHFWNTSYVWFFFLLGAGAWMANTE